MSLDDDSAVDASVARVFTAYVIEGHPPARGETKLAALMWKFPAYGRFGVKRFARSWRAMKGWRRRAPARSRRPHVLAMWAALAIEMCESGHWLMAVYLVWLVATDMRPN